MISLIVATLGRVTELERLLTSLDAQTYKNFEVIVVDQNPDDRLAPVLREHQSLKVEHMRSGPGLSRARNVGLRVAKGDIITIPDDDCWYPRELLASVARWFELHPGFDALFPTMRSETDKPVGPKWPAGPCRCTRANLWHCTTATTAFMRRPVTDAVGLFDEKLGLGAASRCQSGEDVDYFLRALARGFRMWYEPTIKVHHPDLHDLVRLRRISYSYALGLGYLLRVYGYSWREFSGHFVRPLGGILVSLCKCNLARAHTYLLRAAGQLVGYVSGPRALRSQEETLKISRSNLG